jgi:hypothetical protein
MKSFLTAFTLATTHCAPSSQEGSMTEFALEYLDWKPGETPKAYAESFPTLPAAIGRSYRDEARP